MNDTREHIPPLREEPGTHPPVRKNNAIPAAILIAGAIVAVAVFITRSGDRALEAPSTEPGQQQETEMALAPLSENDHILGNPGAPVLLVEYSDTECPFCKTFHNTVERVMESYGKEGRVAVAYRHFPLDQIHTKARREAAGAECAGAEGGDGKFWEYIDRIFEVTPSDDKLPPAQVSEIASEIGLDRTKFEQCLSSGAYDAHIEEDLQSGVAGGVRGTPTTFFVLKNTLSEKSREALFSYFKKYSSAPGLFSINEGGSLVRISGALPYDDVKTIIDVALAER